VAVGPLGPVTYIRVRRAHAPIEFTGYLYSKQIGIVLEF